MTIFIKTYPKDFIWLQYCLRSIAKFASGFDVVLVCDKSGEKELKTWGLTQEKVIYHTPVLPGYIDQQVVKLNADKYTDSEHILFMDSDAIFNQPVTPETFMKVDKPFILKTNYNEFKGDQAYCWKAITEKVMGYPVEFEYMRRLGLMYRASTLKNLREYLGFDLVTWCKENVKGNDFSEFNMMGAYAEKFESDKYVFQDTKEGLPECVINQYWSLQLPTKEVISELNEILK